MNSSNTASGQGQPTFYNIAGNHIGVSLLPNKLTPTQPDAKSSKGTRSEPSTVGDYASPNSSRLKQSVHSKVSEFGCCGDADGMVGSN